MKDRLRVFPLAALSALLAFTSLSHADDYPQGCVDCHVQKTGDTNMRLNALLVQIGHPSVAKVKKVPTSCGGCHAAGEGEENVFAHIIHQIHYDVPKANLFTTKFGGDCLHCHAMDADEGEAVVKSGPRNW